MQQNKLHSCPLVPHDIKIMLLLYFDTMQSVSTFENEVRNSLSMLEPHSTDSLGHQQCSSSVSTLRSANTLALCQSKATLPMTYA